MQPDSPTNEVSRPKPVGPRFRRLRIGMALACLTLCFMAVVLWVQSYRHTYWVRYTPSEHSLLDVYSRRGLLVVNRLGEHSGVVVISGLLKVRRLPVLGTETLIAGTGRVTLSSTKAMFGFHFARRPGDAWTVQLPYQFLTLLFGLLALLFRPSPRIRISLRELLVVITLTSVVSAGAGYLFRETSDTSPSIEDSYPPRNTWPNRIDQHIG